MQVTHAHRVVVPRDLVHHLRSNCVSRRATVGSTPFRGDTGEEALREIVEHGDEPRVFVQTRESFRGHLTQLSLRGPRSMQMNELRVPSPALSGTPGRRC
jgi:hypothetical protein